MCHRHRRHHSSLFVAVGGRFIEGILSRWFSTTIDNFSLCKWLSGAALRKHFRVSVLFFWATIGFVNGSACNHSASPPGGNQVDGLPPALRFRLVTFSGRILRFSMHYVSRLGFVIVAGSSGL